MITINNYFKSIERIGIDKLPETFKKGHELVVKSTANGSTWEAYESNQIIHRVIDSYLKNLNQYLASQPQSKPKGLPETKPKQSKPAIK